MCMSTVPCLTYTVYICLVCPPITSIKYSRAKPSHYDLSLFNLKFGPSWAYEGQVKIDIKVSRETSEFVLNAKELTVNNAEISSPAGMPFL